MTGRSDIGLYLVKSDSSPLLKTKITLAMFNLSVKIPVFNVYFVIIVIGLIKSNFIYCSCLTYILLTPLLVCRGKPSIICMFLTI